MNKEEWINKVMNSLDDVKSAEVNPFLYNKILSKISSGNTEYAPITPIPIGVVWLAAASLALLAILNFTILKSNTSSSKNTSSEVQTLANSYQLLNENALNYNQ